jgi:hypothetical protein
MKPCSSCPFQPSALRGLWSPAHYLLIAYLGSVRDFTEQSDIPRSMGCHKFNGVVGQAPGGKPPRCGGWVRAARDSFPLRMKMPWMSEAELAELDDGIAVLTPEDMARLNGLDMARLPPLAWEPGDARYPRPADWVRAVVELRVRLELDPEHARTFVVPGSPLDIGVDDDDIRAALGDEAADRYAARSA